MVMREHCVRAGRWALLGVGLFVAGCSSTANESGFSFSNLFSRGPEPATASAQGALPYAGYCPSVTVLEGGSSIQQRAGQVILGQLARECVDGPDGTIIVKVGAEGR